MKDQSISQLRNILKQKMSRNTQEKMAKHLGISQPYLSMLLNGKRNPKRIHNLLKDIYTKLNSGFSKN